MSDQILRKLLRQLNQTHDPLDALAVYYQLTRTSSAEVTRSVWVVWHAYDDDEEPGVSIHLTEEGAEEYAAKLIIELLVTVSREIQMDEELLQEPNSPDLQNLLDEMRTMAAKGDYAGVVERLEYQQDTYRIWNDNITIEEIQLML
jgi:hypothetical protein